MTSQRAFPAAKVTSGLATASLSAVPPQPAALMNGLSETWLHNRRVRKAKAASLAGITAASSAANHRAGVGVGGRQCRLGLNPQGTLGLWAAQGPRTHCQLPTLWTQNSLAPYHLSWGCGEPAGRQVMGATCPHLQTSDSSSSLASEVSGTYAGCVCCPARACDCTGAPVTRPHRPVLFPRLVLPQGGPTPGPLKLR